MTKSVILYITSANESKTRLVGSDLFPIKLIDTPRKTAKTIICNTLPDAIDEKGLVGIIPNSVSITLGDSLTLTDEAVPRSTPTPGSNQVAIIKPIGIAIEVVNI